MKLAVLAWVLLGAVSAPLSAAEVSAEEQRQALQIAEPLIEDRYVDPAKAAGLVEALRALRRAVEGPEEGAAFAERVTRRLREASGDGHLGLSYSAAPIADPAEEEGTITLNDDFERWYGRRVNHGVEKIERLDGNVMLLDLRAFPPDDMGADVVSAAMNVVAQGDALIIDLRRNGGGAGTVALIMGHLTKPGAPFLSEYNRPKDEWTHSSVPDWVPGRRFGENKPLYVLVSPRTFSAAEALAYGLQALGRATIVGQPSGGGAHPFEYRKVSAHFALDLPEGKTVHPLTGTNWQGVGVKPDVEVPEGKALETAHRLALETIKDRSAAGSGPRSLP
ncbi:MAG: S41 family peptidase [Novosphingobium sp.]|nr:S41 family peptidase [Novosphingobium sp.]